MNWDLANVHVMEFVVPAESIDVMGHVNNTEYLRFMEQIAWDHTTVLGLGWDLYQKLNRAMVARRTEVDYLAPAFEGEKLVIGTWIVENDERLSITRRYQIIRESDGVTLLRGRTKWVCVALDSGKPRRMPAEFIKGYQITASES
ncbi:MAG: acyl-CoA thioesterase [Alcanivorax sediminis]|uniref:Acyl-CoA thioesterase n=1 Tax=Alcanivorax sediminis TaxID=2663008 RepID=A0A6N7LYI5_9GAMM|nr:thioesterase family protein [Alcanivorax sediminis]MQX54185.1 acyl-CoA thioesterase [Alcanivorax sediminis]